MSIPHSSASPFTRVAIGAVRKLYPESLADKSFDNTGLLLEAAFDPAKDPKQKHSVLLAIDLTTGVADEAIKRRDSLIVSYHPVIFRGLKSITMANSQQRSLLKLAAQGISVYSPHSAVDAAHGGNGDWLADVVTGLYSTPAQASDPQASRGNTFVPSTDQQYTLSHFPHPPRGKIDATRQLPHSRLVIKPNPDHPDAGIGRLLTLEKPQNLSDLLSNLTNGLGSPKAFSVAIPQWSTISDLSITTISICAGSGGSVVTGINADLILTGEMSHHEALAEIENGKVVVCMNHSNSERGYLRNVMQPKLQQAIETAWSEAQKEKSGIDSSNEPVEVHVSEVDRDPFGFVTVTA